MPRLRQTPREIANANFRAAIAGGIARQDLTKGEAAELVGVSVQTLRDYTQSPGAIKLAVAKRFIKHGLLTADDVVAYLTAAF